MTKEKKQSEPFVHVTRRVDMKRWVKIIVRLAAVLVSFLLIMLMSSSFTGARWGDLFKYIFDGNFETGGITQQTFKNVMILLGIAVALAPAFKLRFWNVGAQGQVLFGGTCAACWAYYISKNVPTFSNELLLVIMFVSAVVGGALWALIPAFFKVKTGANETLFTLMMNYIAIQIVKFFSDLWKGSASALPKFALGKYGSVFGFEYGLTYLLVAIVTVLVFVYMRRTKQGYEISVVGESMNTAKYAGINTGKVILRTIAISGAVCGLIGFLFVGFEKSIEVKADGGYGFTAIIVTWASQFNPLAMAAIAFGIVFFESGAGGIQNHFSEILTKDYKNIVVAIFLFLLIGCEFFINYKVNFNERFKNFFKKIWTAIKGFFAKPFKKKPNIAANTKASAENAVESDGESLKAGDETADETAEDTQAKNVKEGE
jgi:simple sugar transport system permease protein